MTEFKSKYKSLEEAIKYYLMYDNFEFEKILLHDLPNIKVELNNVRVEQILGTILKAIVLISYKNVIICAYNFSFSLHLNNWNKELKAWEKEFKYHLKTYFGLDC